MKATKNNRHYLWVVLIVGVLHLMLGVIAFMKSANIKGDEGTLFWRSLSNLLAFPMMHILHFLGIHGGEIAAVMLINGLIWGVVFAFFMLVFYRIRG